MSTVAHNEGRGDMTEEIQVVPDVELMAIPEVDWKDNVLVFNRQLNIQRIEQIYGGLKKFGEGYQLYWTDFWHELDAMEIDWTQYLPDSVAPKTAGNWFRMGDRFTPGLRLNHKHLKASHYIAASQFKLPDSEAIKIIEAAENGKWPEKAVREAVKLVMGTAPKVKKPKVITCPHCDRAALEDIPCTGCALDVAETRIKALREVLEAIRDSEEGDLELYAEFAVESAVRALEV